MATQGLVNTYFLMKSLKVSCHWTCHAPAMLQIAKGLIAIFERRSKKYGWKTMQKFVKVNQSLKKHPNQILDYIATSDLPRYILIM